MGKCLTSVVLSVCPASINFPHCPSPVRAAFRQMAILHSVSRLSLPPVCGIKWYFVCLPYMSLEVPRGPPWGLIPKPTFFQRIARCNVQSIQLPHPNKTQASMIHMIWKMYDGTHTNSLKHLVCFTH